MMVPRLRLSLALCALISAAILAVALASERYGGLVPCALCLVERWPYRIAAPLALAGALLPRRLGWIVLWLCVLVMMAGAATGFVHVGVEQGWWPSPLPECMAPNLSGLSISERLARMPARPSKPCDEPIFLIPAIRLSMAEMNVLAALALSTGLAMFGYTNRKSMP